MKNYEVTFQWPNGDWTWAYVKGLDLHAAIYDALVVCPHPARIHSIVFLTPEQLAANKASAAQRIGGHNV